MTRYVLVFAIAVAGLLAFQSGVLRIPFHWGSHVEVTASLSPDDLRQINFAVQRYANGESKPLKAIRVEEGTGRVLAIYQGQQFEVEGTGGMMCGPGTTYTMAKKNGKWRVVGFSLWFG